MASALSAKTRAAIALAEAMPPRIRHHLSDMSNAPLAVRWAIGRLSEKLVGGEHVGDWPPHRPRPTMRRRAHVGLKRAKHIAEKRKDALCLGVRFGRIELVDRARLLKVCP